MWVEFVKFLEGLHTEELRYKETTYKYYEWFKLRSLLKLRSLPKLPLYS